MCEGDCVKCRRRRKLTRHHILPRRFYGSPPDAPILLICRSCHSDLETLIPQTEKQADQFYWDVLFLFLGSNYVFVIQWDERRNYVVSQMQEAAY